MLNYTTELWKNHPFVWPRVGIRILGDSLWAIEIAATDGKFDLRRIGIQKRDAHPVANCSFRFRIES